MKPRLLPERVILVPAWRVEPPHEVREVRKYKNLVERMREHGWQGRPLIGRVSFASRLSEDEIVMYDAWTGSHRVAAAQRVGLHVPMVVLARELDAVLDARSYLDPMVLRECGALLEARIWELEDRLRAREMRRGEDEPQVFDALIGTDDEPGFGW